MNSKSKKRGNEAFREGRCRTHRKCSGVNWRNGSHETAKGQVRNPVTDMLENVRILLDYGSRRTRLSEILAGSLNLKLGKINELNVVTFGSEKQ